MHVLDGPFLRLLKQVLLVPLSTAVHITLFKANANDREKVETVLW